MPVLGRRARPVGEESLPKPMGAHDPQGLLAARPGEIEEHVPGGYEIPVLQPLKEPDGLVAGKLRTTRHTLRGRGESVVLELVELFEHVFEADTVGKPRMAPQKGDNPPRRPQGDGGEGRKDGKYRERQAWIGHRRWAPWAGGMNVIFGLSQFRQA